MSVKHMLAMEGAVATDLPIRIPFEFKRREHVPEGKDPGDCIVITPVTVGTWFRIRPLLLSIDKDDLDKLVAREGKGIFTAETAEVMERYDKALFDIVCIGLHNRSGDMPAWFRDTLRDNCTWEDIYVLMNALFYRLGHNSFINTITAVQAVSPSGEAETIALQENRKSWDGHPATSCCS